MSDWPELHLACWNNDIDKVKALIDSGANVNAALPDGLTPLHIGNLHVN
jgi:ankyrin repeat protein